jgi:hypothetical protein
MRHIAGVYLLRSARESSWREDNRGVSNGDQVSRVAALAMKRGKSVDLPSTGGGTLSPPIEAAYFGSLKNTEILRSSCHSSTS